MKYNFIFLFKAAFILLVLFHPKNSHAQVTGEPIVIGEKLIFQSEILNEERELWIYKPPSYENSKNKYPVLYLLDGDNHFHHTTGIIQFLATRDRMPEMMVVALPNTAGNRTRDLTPPTQVDRTNDYPASGGADNFLRFINDELIPYVDNNYRTTSHKTLVGHSLGGLFVIHSLLTRPEIFNDYIAISPALWWDDAAIISRADSILEINPDLIASLYMTLGNEDSRYLSNIWKLAAIFEEKTPDSFHWNFKLMKEENHGSIPHRSTYLGLEALYPDWRIPNLFELVKSDGIEAVDKHYQRNSEKIGYTIQTPEAIINQIGYWYLQQDKIKDAIKLFKRNVKEYPGSANVYDSLGDGYKANNKLKKAKENYKKAVELAITNSDPFLYAFQANLEDIEKRINSKESQD